MEAPTSMKTIAKFDQVKPQLLRDEVNCWAVIDRTCRVSSPQQLQDEAHDACRRICEYQPDHNDDLNHPLAVVTLEPNRRPVEHPYGGGSLTITSGYDEFMIEVTPDAGRAITTFEKNQVMETRLALSKATTAKNAAKKELEELNDKLAAAKAAEQHTKADILTMRIITATAVLKEAKNRATLPHHCERSAYDQVKDLAYRGGHVRILSDGFFLSMDWPSCIDFLHGICGLAAHAVIKVSCAIFVWFFCSEHP
jgi:hypothetical protein